MQLTLKHWKNRLRLSVRQLDKFFEGRANRLLPQQLTKRYVLGLGCVALVACCAQLLEQLSFHLQYRGFAQVRRIEAQNEASLRFSRSAQQLRYMARQSLLEDRLAIAERELAVLEESNRRISDQSFFERLGAGGARRLGAYFDFAESGITALRVQLTSVAATVRAQGPSVDFPKNRRLALQVEELLKVEHTYRASLGELAHYYETLMNERIQFGRVFNLALTVLIVLLLSFVGLYVIRPAVRQLLEAMDARSKFLGRMGNEIRNPMNSILGMTRLLQDTRLSEQQRHYTSVLQSSGNSLMSLLNNLIDYSRISSGKVLLEYCEIDLLSTVQDCLDLVTYKADRKGVELLLQFDPQTSLRLTTDPLLLQQVLLNLLENAVKFTEEGQITLAVWQTRDFGRSRLHFSVTDSGIGISEAKLGEIFDHFQQEDASILRKYGGSGLGLGICLELVKLAGGDINVQSRKGEGSVFHFQLPVTRFSEEVFVDLFQARAIAGSRALVAEQHPGRRAKLQEFIELYGGHCTLPPEKEGDWPEFFAKNEFDLLVVNYEQQPRLISHLQQAEGRWPGLLSRVVLLLRSTTESTRIMRLNSIGVKTFCYLPVKPVEFLAAVGLVTNQKVTSPRSTKGEEKLTTFELARPISALVVDDSRDNQFLMKNYLEKHTNLLVLADNGVEALEKFRQNSFDIVFLDLLMPELDGFETAQQIRGFEAAQGRPPVPVVAVSAHTGEEEVERCRESGFTAHLSKPLDLAELHSFLGRVFGEKVNPMQSDNRNEELDATWQAKLKEYLPNYFRQRQEDLRVLRVAAAGGDWDKVSFIGHKIKGSAATYGFPELGQAGAELESFAVEKNLPEVNGKIEYIDSWLKTVVNQ